jgi:hypothetical protein
MICNRCLQDLPSTKLQLGTGLYLCEKCEDALMKKNRKFGHVEVLE